MDQVHQHLFLKWGCIIALVLIMIIGGMTVFSKQGYYGQSNENLTNVPFLNTHLPHHSMEGKQIDIPIKPTVYDAGSGTIMSGPDFIPSQYLSPWYQAYTGNMKNHYLLDDGAGGSAGLQFNMCSKSCCSDQYPLPFKMPVDSEVCASKADFVPTNYMCNNAWQDSGCVCMTKDQANFIGSRGGNA